MRFIKETIAAGWDPTAPSEECIRRTMRPQMPEYLSPLDKRGIHWLLVDLEILRSFPTARNKKTPPRQVEVTALLHALRAERISLAELGLDRFRSIHEELGPWLDERMRPSESRLNAAFAAEMSHEKFESRILEFEPAWTRNVLQLDLKTTDWEGNRKAVLEGVRLSELRGVTGVRARTELRRGFGLALTDADVHRILPLLTASNPGQNLYEVTRAGQFRLVPSRVRDALESVLGAVQPVHEERGQPLPEKAGDLFASELATPAQEAAEVEGMVILRQIVASKRDDAPEGSPARIVLDHFEAINAGQVTARQLWRETGVSRKQLDRALAAVRDDLKKTLGLRDP